MFKLWERLNNNIQIWLTLCKTIRNVDWFFKTSYLQNGIVDNMLGENIVRACLLLSYISLCWFYKFIWEFRIEERGSSGEK